MGRRGNEATTQGISTKMVCRGWDERMKQGKNQEGGTNKEEPNKEEPKKEKPPASIEGKMRVAGGKILR